MADLDLPPEINVITLNCWGLKYVSKLRNERLAEIGRRLAASDPPPHIVALQECFAQEDYLRIRRETKHVLPHGKFFFSGAFGSGLAILSRWPVEESSMFRYPLNGRPAAFWRGDWYVGKGVASARIRYGPKPGDVLEVFNTHTHAPYEDSYLCHRLAQSWELGKILRAAAHRGHLVLALGDFNMRPGSLPYRLLADRAPFHDAWRVLHPDSSLGTPDDPPERARRRPIPTAEFNLRENGVTSDSAYCTWRWTGEQQRLLHKGRKPRSVARDAIDPKAKRLDYIFFADGARLLQQRRRPAHRPISKTTPATTADNTEPQPLGGWVVKSAKVGMVDPHPDLHCSLSDHFSVEATLVYHVPKLPSPTSNQQQGQQSQPNHLTTPQPSNHRISDPATSYLQSPTASEDGTRPPHGTSHSRSQSDDDDNNPSSSSKPSSSHNPPNIPRKQATPAELDAQLLANSSSISPSPSTHSSTSYPYALGDKSLPQPTYDDILSTISAYQSRQSTQRLLRSLHATTWLLVCLASLTATWFIPLSTSYRPLTFILVFLSTLGAAICVPEALMALLFFGSEQRALAEFEWEVRNARALSSTSGREGWEG